MSLPSNAPSCASRRLHQNGNVNTHWRSPLCGGSTRSMRFAAGLLAELAAARGKLEEALAYQRHSLAMDRARAAASPGSFQAGKDLAETWSAVSDLLSRLGRLDAALEASGQSLALFEKLLAGNPGQSRLHQLMAAQYARHGTVLEAIAARSAAGTDAAVRSRDGCSAFHRSLELWKGLETAGASIDDEHRAQSAEMESTAARCAPTVPR